MSWNNGSGKLTRRYGSFSTDPKNDKAASLFDAVFSAPPKASTSQMKKEANSFSRRKRATSPKKVELPTETKSRSPSSTTFSSPTASIPDIAIEKSDSSDSEDNVQESSQSSLSSISIPLSCTSVSDAVSSVENVEASKTDKKKIATTETSKQLVEKVLGSEVGAAEDDDVGDDEFDFECSAGAVSPPQPKRMKSDEAGEGTSITQDSSASKQHVFSLLKKERKPIYKHKWDSDEASGEDERALVAAVDEPVSRSKVGKDKTVKNSALHSEVLKVSETVSCGSQRLLDWQMNLDARTVVSNVKEAHQCLESGEHDDYRQDLEYILSTLLDEESTNNLKCLSVISLARKCVSGEFRQFFRSHNFVGKTLKALADSPTSPSLSVCVAVVVYLLARDKMCVEPDPSTLRLLSQMLKMEKPENNQEYTKAAKMAWGVLHEWFVKARQSYGSLLQFDFTVDTFSPSSVVLEALVYISVRNRKDQTMKNEMLGLGTLQWLVSKVDKTVLRLLHEKMDDSEYTTSLAALCKCYRVLESCSIYCKRNQAYLISHRGSALIHSSGRLMGLCFRKIEEAEDPESDLVKATMICVSEVAAELMTISHENELCCSKLGQISGFLPLCLSFITYLAPKFATRDKCFDLIVLMSSLVVNLVERCNSNRRKLIESRVNIYNPGTKQILELPALRALAQMFLFHDAAARTVDEELDNDLVLEDAPNGNEPEDDEATESDGRLHRLPTELTEDEMASALQSVMNKASNHMEDSVIASYVALIVGCLMQQNEESIAVVKSEMPGEEITSMVDQLQRFFEFMKLTLDQRSSQRSVERILELLTKLSERKN